MRLSVTWRSLSILFEKLTSVVCARFSVDEISGHIADNNELRLRAETQEQADGKGVHFFTGLAIRVIINLSLEWEKKTGTCKRTGI